MKNVCLTTQYRQALFGAAVQVPAQTLFTVSNPRFETLPAGRKLQFSGYNVPSVYCLGGISVTGKTVSAAPKPSQFSVLTLSSASA